jgi:hypothetical protein
VPKEKLIDPLAKTLEPFGLESGRWVLLTIFAENDKVRTDDGPA